MIEQWIENLGGVVERTIYVDGETGYATFGPVVDSEWEGVEPGPALRLRYGWTYIDVGWGPTFDRWANSVDWKMDPVEDFALLREFLSECIRRGECPG
ncbi:MAG: hypothetical protein QUS11_06565 [Candidatus Fermentibacter sp.]|nr:hypothetical protein [Candidatus Fermentibacter sp.]